MQLIVSNKRNKVIKFIFPSAQKYDFVVKRNEKEVWRWSKDKMFAMVLTEFMLEPRQSVIYQEKWEPQEFKDGKVNAFGVYEIVGILKIKPEIISPSVFIEITN